MVNLKNIPPSPGVYIYRNLRGDIIYVGKAINLYKRVSQYFQRDDALGPKTKTLVSQIDSIETRVVSSEIEALVLESSLIKKYLPKYNSQLRDDKAYIYICISREPIPRVFSTHLSKLKVKADIYGPFPNGSAVRSLLKSIRHIFPYRSLEFHPRRDCLFCHLGLCPGPNPDITKYRQNISKIKKILSGKFTLLQRQLQKELTQTTKLENYEAAQVIYKQLESVNYIVSGWHNLESLYSRIDLPEDRSSQALLELQTTLHKFFPDLTPNRLECFDVSQLGSRYFVGSMVVFKNGRLDNSQYRKFRIKSKDSPDDQFMIRELLYRRLRHPEWGSPDLVIVDGGKPQVAAARMAAPPNLPIIGLAKKEETIVLIYRRQFIEIRLPHHSSALQLIQNLRDEAHRFANSYRKNLMKAQLL